MLSMEGNALHAHFFPKKTSRESYCDHPLGSASGLILKPNSGAIDEKHSTYR